jgi:hypothetical protein
VVQRRRNYLVLKEELSLLGIILEEKCSDSIRERKWGLTKAGVCDDSGWSMFIGK